LTDAVMLGKASRPEEKGAEENGKPAPAPTPTPPPAAAEVPSEQPAQAES
jgi:hypothetical protein